MSANEAGVTDTARGYRKTREGLVVSDKMEKTVVVAVEDRFKHPLYGKVVRRTSKLKAHDEANTAGVGDRVLLCDQALARGRDPRKGQVVTTKVPPGSRENRQTIRRMQ